MKKLKILFKKLPKLTPSNLALFGTVLFVSKWLIYSNPLGWFAALAMTCTALICMAIENK